MCVPLTSIDLIFVPAALTLLSRVCFTSGIGVNINLKTKKYKMLI